MLVAWGKGDRAALEEMIPLVFDELHRQTERYLRHERPGHIMQPTALVNETYLRLIDCDNIQWQNRAHLTDGWIAVSAVGELKLELKLKNKFEFKL